MSLLSRQSPRPRTTASPGYPRHLGVGIALAALAIGPAACMGAAAPPYAQQPDNPPASATGGAPAVMASQTAPHPHVIATSPVPGSAAIPVEPVPLAGEAPEPFTPEKN